MNTSTHEHINTSYMITSSMSHMIKFFGDVMDRNYDVITFTSK